MHGLSDLARQCRSDNQQKYELAVMKHFIITRLQSENMRHSYFVIDLSKVALLDNMDLSHFHELK